MAGITTNQLILFLLTLRLPVPTAARQIEGVFKELYPPKGVSWDNWQIANQKKGRTHEFTD
jgi:hypothetical protein